MERELRTVAGCALAAVVCVALTCPAHTRAEEGKWPRTIDDELSDLALEVPGFGGAFYESDGTPAIWLVASSREPEARAALKRRFPGHFTQQQMRIYRADYGFDQLVNWKRAASRALLPGMWGVDADERSNRVRVLVEPGSKFGIAALEAFGIPGGAVVVEERPLPQEVSTLQDWHQYGLWGGLRISWYDNLNAQYACTLGVYVHSNAALNSFLTASHCSPTPGAPINVVYYQPSTSSQACSGKIGHLVADPPYASGGSCPANKVCRNSDAAIAASEVCGWAGQYFVALSIANTLYTNNGSITENSLWPRLALPGGVGAGHAPAGSTMYKVGATTGRTSGTLKDTCIDLGVANTNRYLWCQDSFACPAGVVCVAGGDSGSAVSDGLAGDPGSHLVGVLWGADASLTTAYYSFIDGVQQDLGVIW